MPKVSKGWNPSDGIKDRNKKIVRKYQVMKSSGVELGECLRTLGRRYGLKPNTISTIIHEVKRGKYDD
jgi:hypothetical protein